VNVVIHSPGLRLAHGGAAHSEASLARYLSREISVKVLAAKQNCDPNFVAQMGCPTPTLYRTWDPIVALMLKSHWLHDWLNGVDIFHLNGHWKVENFFFARLCHQKKIPYVFHPRGMLWLEGRRPVLKRLYNLVFGHWIVAHANSVIALSEFEKRHFESYEIESSRVTVIANGIDPNLDVDGPVKKERCFIYLGRIESRKKLDSLLLSFAEYLKSGGQFSLKLVGPVERGYDEVLRRLEVQLGIQGKIEWIAPQYGKAKWESLKAASALIYPAIEEAFGRVPFESLWVGTLPVVPIESGAYEYLKGRIPDVFYPVGALDSLTQVLISIEKNIDSEIWISKIQEAQKYVRNEFSWRHVIHHVLKLYRNTVGLTQGETESLVFEPSHRYLS